MSEIYWLSRLDELLTILGIICTVSTVAALFMAILAVIDREEELVMPAKTTRKLLRHSMITALVTGLACVFVLSSKQAYMIFGIGPAVDYFQESDVASQLPDKCVKALEAWVDSMDDKEE